jgi:hypothetical protein
MKKAKRAGNGLVAFDMQIHCPVEARSCLRSCAWYDEVEMLDQSGAPTGQVRATCKGMAFAIIVGEVEVAE